MSAAFDPRSVAAIGSATATGTSTQGNATPAATASPPSPSRQSISAVQNAVGRIRAAVATPGRTLNFQVDRNSGLVVVTVTDNLSGDVISRFPGNAILQAADALDSDGDGSNPHVDVRA